MPTRTLCLIAFLAVFVAGCWTRTEVQIQNVDGVEFRSDGGENNFSGDYQYDFGRSRRFGDFQAWAFGEGLAVEPSLYRIGSLGDPPSECGEACTVYLAAGPFSSQRRLKKAYLIYVDADGQILRIDNAHQYEP